MDDFSHQLCSTKNSLFPRHVAIILDGNGRWATQRALPRTVGHRKGVDAVRNIVQEAVTKGICYLTLFAFSSENWHRPQQEIALLKRLFYVLLRREVKRLHARGIRLQLIGDMRPFGSRMVEASCRAELLTAENDKMLLTIALNYGGRWDILNATKEVAIQAMNEKKLPEIDEHTFAQRLSLRGLPDPDLIIRTGGEKRISNFLLWHSAYSEFYFTDILWPDFDSVALNDALICFAKRTRRYGTVCVSNTS